MAFQDIGIRIKITGIAQVQRDIAGLKTQLNSLTNTVSTANTNTFSLSSSLNSLGDTFVSVGRKLTVGLTVPLALVGTQLIKTGIDFEEAFVGVTKTVDGLSDEFGNLTEKGIELEALIRDLSGEMPIAATEIAGVTQAAGQLGVRGVDSLISFTATAIKMGLATDFTAKQAATEFARMANIVGVESDKIDEFFEGAGNAAVALGNNFAATEPEIVALTLRILGAGNAIGVTTQDVLGIATALAAVGVRAELGGSAISRIFMEMRSASSNYTTSLKTVGEQQVELTEEFLRFKESVKRGVPFEDLVREYEEFGRLDLSGLESDLEDVERGTKSLGNVLNDVRIRSQTKFTKELRESSEQMKAFSLVTGLTVTEFNNLIKTDPTEAFLKIISGLNRMNEEGILSDDVFESLGLNAQRTKDVVTRLAPNIDLVTRAVDTSTEAWEDQIALQEEYNKKQNTVASKIQLTKNAWNNLGITLFKIVEPAIRKVLESITLLLGKLNNLLENSPTARNRLLGIAAAALVLGPALTGVGLALKGIGLAFGGLKLLVPVGGFVIANPVSIPIILGIGGAILAVKNNLLGLGDAFDKIAESFRVLKDSLLFFNLKEAFKFLLDGDIENALWHLKTSFGIFKFWLSNVFFTTLEELFNSATSDTEGWIESLSVWVNETWDRLDINLGNLSKEMRTWVSEQAPLIAAKLELWTTEFWKWFRDDAAPAIFKELEIFINDLIPWLGEQVPIFLQELIAWRVAFVHWAGEVWKNLLPKLGNILGNILGWIVAKAILLAEKIVTEWVPGFVRWAIKVWPELRPELNNLLDEIADFILNDFSKGIEDAIKEVGRGLIQGFIDGMGERMPDLESFINDLGFSLPQWFKDKIKSDSPSKLTMEIGKDFVDGFIIGIENNKTRAREAVADLASTLSAPFQLDSSLVTGNIGLATGGTMNTSNVSNIHNKKNSIFSPTINSVPITDEQSLNNELLRSFRMAQQVMA